MPLKGKRLSAEEALNLILETTDQDSDSDSDVDILSEYHPHLVGPSATKIVEPEPEYFIEISSNSENDLHELQPARRNAQEPSLSSSCDTSSPASSPSSSSPVNTCKPNRPKKTKPSKPQSVSVHIPPETSTKRSRSLFNYERPSDVPSRSPERSPEPVFNYDDISSSSPEPASSSPDPLIFSSSESSEYVSSSPEYYSQGGSAENAENGSRFLPPENFPGPPNLKIHREIWMK